MNEEAETVIILLINSVHLNFHNIYTCVHVYATLAASLANSLNAMVINKYYGNK